MNSPAWKYLHIKIVVILWLNFSLGFNLFKLVVKQFISSKRKGGI